MPGLLALDLAPRRRGGPAARALALATAERVSDRIHGHAAHLRALPQPPALARLADRQELVLGIPDFTYRGQAAAVHQAHLG